MSARRAVVAVGSGLWLVAYGWPLAAVLSRSLGGVAGRDGLGVESLSVLWDDRTARLFGITFAQTALSTLVVTILGVPIGWTLARIDFRGRRVVNALVMVPFVLPTLTIASAVLAVVGGLPRGNGARFGLIIAAHVCLNLGLMVRAVSAAVSSVPVSMEETARSLGRSPITAVCETTLRVIRPQILNAALLVSMFCLTSFGVITALGTASLSTIEVEVWYLSTRSLDLGRAAVLVAGQLIVVLLLVAVQARFTSRPPSGVGSRRRRPRSRGERSLTVASTAVVAVIAGGPIVALALRSFRTAAGWGIANYSALFGDAGPARGPAGTRSILRDGDALAALGYSVLGALIATVLALLLAAPLVVAAGRDDALGRIVDRLLIVPLAISAATLGLGFLLAYSGPRLDLRGTWIVVPLVQAATAAPVAARLLVGSVRSLDRTPWHAASVLGAGPLRRFSTIAVPLLRRPLAVAAGFAFAMAIGEFGATVFLARNDRPTLPILIGRLLGRPGAINFGAAMALSCVLASIVVLAIVLVDRRGRSDLA